MVGFSLKRFWFYGGIIALMQYGLLFVLGYFLGQRVGADSSVVHNVEYGLTILLLVGTVYYIGAWYLRRRFVKRTESIK
jgi:membrane protein DedA with SNARE-associated domain